METWNLKRDFVGYLGVFYLFIDNMYVHFHIFEIFEYLKLKILSCICGVFYLETLYIKLIHFNNINENFLASCLHAISQYKETF